MDSTTKPDTQAKKPNCYDCAHRREIPGDAHTRCNNHKANVKGSLLGIRNGWFMWPLNFDPTWLEACNGFSTSEEDRKAETKRLDPLVELFSMLR